MQAVGLKTHIWNNNLRTIVLLAGFPVLMVGLVFGFELMLMAMEILPTTGSVMGDLAYALRLLWASVPVAIAVSLIWFAIAYFANTAIVSLATGARTVTRKDEPELYNLLENLAISRGLRTPKLQVIDSEALNAFASGVNERQYTITVTRGLMNTLDREELEAVLAHELTHVINRDVRTMMVAAVFAGVITLIAQTIFRAMRHSRIARGSRKGTGLFILLALIIAAIGYGLAIVIRMAVSRSREFVADAGSVELTKNPDAMISALRKISGRSQLEAPEQVRAMFLENRESGVFSLFATHPPIEQRIEALTRFAGGREALAAASAAGPWS